MTDDGVVRGRLAEGTDQPPVQPQQHADAPAPALHTDEEQSIDSSWINAGSSQLTLSASGISGKSPDIPQGAQNTPKPALYAGGKARAVGCGLGLWARARRANAALICSGNIYIYGCVSELTQKGNSQSMA